MPKSKTQRVQFDPLADVDTCHAFPRLRLTAEQWDEISKVSGIPNTIDEARKSIEIAIGLFRQFQAKSQLPAAKLRKEFRALAEMASNLDKRFSDLVDNNREAYTALVGDLSAEAQRPMQDKRRRLSQISNVLLGLPKWFSIAASRVKGDKRGPKSENVYSLVGHLDGIRAQFTGKKITRSYKDPNSVKYIKCVCKIADPNIESGTIDQAMKYRIQHSSVD
jgi:hypothetical protein